jgi:antitoxin component of MazEF toxin-antitoxin module
MYKLRIYGLNAVFGLKIQISLGETLLTAVATGTAGKSILTVVYARALAIPLPLKVMRNLDIIDEEDEKLMEVQRKLMSISEANRKRIEEALATIKDEEAETDESDRDSESSSSRSDSDDEEESQVNTSTRARERTGVVVQIDDEADEDLVLFFDDAPRHGFQMVFIS